MRSKLARRSAYTVVLILFCASLLYSQTPPPADIRELASGQTLEREMTGAVTHRYQFALQANEFFQVRVEQNGVDVTLKLLDKSGVVLATMDSPNGKTGFETLTWVAAKSGEFVLEIVNSDAKLEKGIYLIKREASRTATEKDQQQVEIEKDFVEGVAAVIELSNKYQKADTILKENFKKPENSKADAAAARIKFQEALAIFRFIKPKANDEDLKLKISRFGGKESENLSASLRNIAIYASLNEALTLDRIAQTHFYRGEWNEYLEYKKLAVIAYQDLLATFKDELERSDGGKRLLFAIRDTVAGVLDNMATTLNYRFGQFEESIRYSEQAVELYQTFYRETQNKNYKLKEAMALANIALSYTSQSKYKAKAIEYFTKALEIFRTIPSAKSKVAETLSSIGSAYFSVYDYESARKYLEESLDISRELNDKHGQTRILNNYAVMYLALNNQSKFKEYIKQTLDILESADYEENWKKTLTANENSILSISTSDGIWGEITDNLLKRARLQSIGFCYQLLKEYAKSLEYYKQALEVARSSKDQDGIRSCLRDVATALAKLERWNEAADYYRQALVISRQTQDKEALAQDLQDIGWTLLETGKAVEALTYQNEALLTYQSVGVDENKSFSPSYSTLLNEISRTHYALGNRRLAIFLGKRAVNAIQSERKRLQTLDEISQRGFLENKEKHYRRLADWLIAERRLPEAQAVLSLLKEKEFAGFLRRNGGVAESVPYSKAEAAALAVLEQLAALGREKGELNDKNEKGALTDAERQRFKEIQSRIEIAEAAFDKALKVLSAATAASQNYEAVAADAQAFMSDLRELGGGTVALYTVIVNDAKPTDQPDDKTSAAPKTGWVILVTPEFRKAYPIDVTDLNTTVAAFRAALQSPLYDPQPLAQKLYQKLFRQPSAQQKTTLEADLAEYLKNRPDKTLMWSLDGVLRYVPIAALHDGQTYLVEKYRNTVFTTASKARLKNPVNPHWTVLGLGVSQARTENGRDFPALAGAGRELRLIIRPRASGNAANAPGILPGSVKLDEEFTGDAMFDALNFDKNPVVHIASHFSYQPADFDQSFLLLGQGRLTVKDLSAKSTLFSNVDLLTLSACETAVGGANGKDVEGFAYVAQALGAKAVIATLWQVDDIGTQILMPQFYRLHESGKDKAEALRQAQLALLKGTIQDAPAGITRAEIVGADKNEFHLTPYDAKGKPPFAHPFYWSPFVLIGNWR